MINRLKRVLVPFVLSAAAVLLWAMPAASAPDPSVKPVQVFDVKAGKVVKTIPNDAEYQRYAAEWLSSVTGLSPQLKPNEKCGFVYRVPLSRPIATKVGGQTIEVDDVFLFYCEEFEPVLLVFDAERKPYLLNFKADLKPFLRKIAAP
ncbi:VirB6 component [Paenibacillus darwinianus]|uniref:VirB6 component n=1 Tax=Paenibacillus darwinianus TaxID=1380763 RepID=A0A9W5S3A0_9BACL|nr:hypothetical protein [Paenibacillus darwinianus]EXX91117.1 VirB6 component [Paenibacillus darwinianus]EXX91949.1 VirB6 component [Paenibacillus darwinianus]EXX92640.1 VirB6 component [Paenibacillus darwinianus]